MVSIISLVISIPLSLGVANVLSMPMLGIGFVLMITIGFVFIGTTIIQVLKRGRPPGFLDQYLAVSLYKVGLFKSKYKLPNGPFLITRTKKEVSRGKKISASR